VEIDNNKYPLPKRMRHHTSPNLYFPLEELKEKPEHYPPLYNELDWDDIFLNKRKPDVLDVGCGKGKLLLDFAELNPDVNILGIEVRSQPVKWLNNVIEGERIANAAVIWYSVVNGLPFIESSSVDKIFYLFPDPWFKFKHKKRRAFNEKTIEEFHRVLKIDGILYLASDVPEVNEYHKSLINDTGKFTYEIADDTSWGLPITNKEKFCRKQNIDYLRMKCYKI
jgi:tRNA (guanine-N7-)-methyltransferase